MINAQAKIMNSARTGFRFICRFIFISSLDEHVKKAPARVGTSRVEA